MWQAMKGGTMKPNRETAALVRAIAILRLIAVDSYELGNASVLQAVRLNHEEAREVLDTLRGTRVSARKAPKMRSAAHV